MASCAGRGETPEKLYRFLLRHTLLFFLKFSFPFPWLYSLHGISKYFKGVEWNWELWESDNEFQRRREERRRMNLKFICFLCKVGITSLVTRARGDVVDRFSWRILEDDASLRPGKIRSAGGHILPADDATMLVHGESFSPLFVSLFSLLTGTKWRCRARTLFRDPRVLGSFYLDLPPSSLREYIHISLYNARIVPQIDERWVGAERRRKEDRSKLRRRRRDAIARAFAAPISTLYIDIHIDIHNYISIRVYLRCIDRHL